MKATVRLFILIMGSASLMGLMSCEKEGPAERAGEDLDEAVENTGDEIEDATD